MLPALQDWLLEETRHERGRKTPGSFLDCLALALAQTTGKIELPFTQVGKPWEEEIWGKMGTEYVDPASSQNSFPGGLS